MPGPRPDDDWRFRSVRTEAGDLYVHLGGDGSIFVATGDGVSHRGWATVEGLRRWVDEVPPAGRIFLCEPRPTGLTTAPARLVRDAPTTVIEAGEVPEARADRDGATALTTFAAAGATDLVVDLLGRGAAVDQADVAGATALHAAAGAGHPAVVDALLAAGADRDRAADDGTTPLMAAAASGHAFVVRRLLEAGADGARTRPDGPTGAPVRARDLAARAGHRRTAALLGGAVAGPADALVPGPGAPAPPLAGYRGTDARPARSLRRLAVGLVVVAPFVGALLLLGAASVVVGAVAAVVWLAIVAGALLVAGRAAPARLAIDGWQVEVRPVLGAPRRLDLREVTAVSWYGGFRTPSATLALRTADGRSVKVAPASFTPGGGQEALVTRLAALPAVVGANPMAERELAAARGPRR